MARRRIAAHGESAATGYRRSASRVLGLPRSKRRQKAGGAWDWEGSGPSRQLGLPRLGGIPHTPTIDPIHNPPDPRHPPPGPPGPP
ncbi:hypothetical protein OsJ_21822 [Oryza sativa Japonica Group]|uniref:Uncharacterized protein n=2 Tax=Oryza TaxID=4527 RepID=B9FTY3_ORYSJ|nr:hypothetical protein OsJ_21822 [Oryza sativa Japonica Group]